MNEYFTAELIATLILPIIATMGLMHSRRILARRPAVRQMVRDTRGQRSYKVNFL